MNEKWNNYRHKSLRKALIITLRTNGVAIPCPHDCGVPIEPDTPSNQLDLAHVPGSATEYMGLSHAHCNRSDGSWGERRTGRPKAGARFGVSSGTSAYVPPTRAMPSYEQMERGYDLEHFGRTGVADGETTTDAQGRTWQKVGHTVVHAWWLDAERDAK
jgi:hypothetical protein